MGKPPGTSTERNCIHSFTTSVSGQGRLRFTENGLAEGARTLERSLRARVLVLPKERWDVTIYIIRELLSMAETFMENCNTIKAAAQTVATGKFLSLYSLEDANHVRARKPVTFLDVTNFMTERQVMKNQFCDKRPPYTKP